jgi:zinc protease
MATPPTTRLSLPNGLQVILREVHSAPVIAHTIAYRVGSRNERTGQTGISHWVEHMMFKGTERFPAGALDKAIDRVGGAWNASTSTDYTQYYQTLPAQHIGLALASEADRMMNALFDPDEVENERTVIISERQGNENRPMFWLGEAMRATAFRVHGYHHEIIGDMADLCVITRDDLYAHYQAHYVPANATLVVVGAFETSALLRQIEDTYGLLPALPTPALFQRAEPDQMGERRVIVERPGETAYVRVAFRAPAATHDDWFRLTILDSILTGAGGGLDNKTSRLYQALEKTGLCAGVGGGLQTSIDPYLYTVSLLLNTGVAHAAVERALFTEIERVQQDGISEAELARARKQAAATFAYGTETVSNQAYYLAQAAMLGDTYWFDHYLERLNAVTREDVQDAAQRYLVPRSRTVGWLVKGG